MTSLANNSNAEKLVVTVKPLSLSLLKHEETSSSTIAYYLCYNNL